MYISPFFKENNIAILSACNNKYIPYLAALLRSLMNHFSSTNNYDIILLEFDIKKENKDKILNMIDESAKNISIRFYKVPKNIRARMKDCEVGKWSIELWITLLAPYILTEFNKVVYMDCDVINRSDIAELYKNDIKHYLVGAVRLLGRAVWKDNGFLLESMHTYYNNSSMTDITSYFNNGVMLLNLEEFRKNYSLEYIMNFIKNQNFQLLDQDCINYLCEGRVKYVDAGWNWYPYTEDEFTNTIAICPEELREYFWRGYLNSKNIHYTIPVKPWLEMYGCYFESALYFWRAALETEFYSLLLERMREYQEGQALIGKYIFRSWEDLQRISYGKKILVYGYGNRGKEFIRRYSDDFNLCAIIDQDEGKWQENLSIPIRGLDSINEYGKEISIVIAVEDYTDIIKVLCKKGYQNLFVYSCMQKTDIFSWKIAEKDIKDMQFAFGVFSDEKSLKIYSALIQKRNYLYHDQNIKCLDIYEGNAYFRNDFFKFSDMEVYIDVDEFNEHTRQFFEKYVNNCYKKVISIKMNQSGYVINVSNKNGDEVNCTNLEECILNDIVTFIKVNVKDTLNFLIKIEEVIKAYKPKLAICVSNNYADLWKVPIYIKKVVPEYSLYMRHHSVSLALTVIYVSL